ncbi:carboxypeptidase B-like [Anticarsia gemmatalis]|uniref:carboxypeptidase B-like n=1 Tax=Anticarsia gemmatalis TaxID=129554 RepID=UPI003F76DA6D
MSLTLKCIFLIFLHTATAKKSDISQAPMEETDVYQDLFENFSVYEVTAFNKRERAVLHTLYVTVNDMVFVNGVTNEASFPMVILVDKCCLKEFETIMRDNNIEYLEASSDNIIDKRGSIKVQLHKKPPKELNFTREFFPLDVIQHWLTIKEKKFPALTHVKIGETYERRDIFLMKISTGGRKKKAVFLMGGEQGNDWVSSAILMNVVASMLETRSVLKPLLKIYDFYFHPFSNPDGYMYSITTDRTWTKNCRLYYPLKPCSDTGAILGINIDRNWYFDKMTVSKDECDAVFVGPKSLSEQETYSVAKFLDSIAENMMAFINIRGFDNLVTIPYAYDAVTCNNYDVLQDILGAVQEAVSRKMNVTFSYGLAAKTVFNFTGNAADFVKRHFNTPIVYTFYMKYEFYVLPSASDVGPLTDRFVFMLREILLLANTFYGPLFNGISSVFCSVSIWMIFLLLFMIFGCIE